MSVVKTVVTIEDYIRAFPGETGETLSRIRKCILEMAPDSAETIKYSMPTILNNGNLIHFGVFKKHIGIYPVPRSDEKLLLELSPYIAMKGTIRFPLSEPVPYDLIKRIVRIRLSENYAKTKGHK